MQSFVKIKSWRNGEITLSFTYEGMLCHIGEFLRRKYVFKRYSLKFANLQYQSHVLKWNPVFATCIHVL